MTKKTVNVTLFIDDTCSMARVDIGDEAIFEGNEWDFHPGCHGPIDLSHEAIPINKVLNNFHGSNDFFQQVVSAYKLDGYDVVEKEDSYRYDDDE